MKAAIFYCTFLIRDALVVFMFRYVPIFLVILIFCVCIKDCSVEMLLRNIKRKDLVNIMFNYVTAFSHCSRGLYRSKLFWRTTLISIKRNALVVIMSHYVSYFPHHPQFSID